MKLETREDLKKRLWIESLLSDRDVFEMCFDLAWDHGHAYGHNGVEHHFHDLEEIFDKVYRLGYKTGRQHESWSNHE